MKRNYIVRLLVLLTGISLAACQNKKPEDNSSHKQHAQVDTSLNYLLKPVNEQVVASIPVIHAGQGSRIYIREVQGRVTYDTRNQVNLASRVSGRIEKLYIKYNYQPVKKGQLILELYSPDLAAAQRELLMIERSGNQDQMLESAKQRLMLLGMNLAQIGRLIRTGDISYRIPVYSNATGYILEKQAAASVANAPAPKSAASASAGMDNMTSGGGTSASQAASTPVSSPVLLREGQYLSAGQSIFTIYRTGDLVAEFSLTPQVASQLNKKAKVIIQRTANKEESLTGNIGLIQPVFNSGENFVLARVYLQKDHLQVGELVTGQFPFLSGKGYWLPKETVFSTGNRSIIFKKVGKVFIPKTVKTGIVQNNQIQVLDELNGWEIARNAYYLIDSESFIKTESKGD
ncbi:efflux RND transporter periplasmic adaptor subunit [Pedobacter nutrimenti]|uniref:HlyD family secretion protein n=1 Tax=Pedobacter nutrimenti TaxID=1241337 RepID=A0A318UGP1_9SPHI|nr:efflux RND transporter periplasmic adaptor subunit [Pedobacter nutrimenti]PYF74660.1 HlyD family secretion protein [Pedobacter nutrimenti]